MGNRAAIQMREYKDHRPFLIVGETADDYLGEYMAGGVVVILNMSGQPKSVGSYVGTGMVGGRIYVRGKVGEEQIGLQPKKADILNYLKGYALDQSISQKKLSTQFLRLIFLAEKTLEELLAPEIFKRVRNLYFSEENTQSRSRPNTEDSIPGDDT